MPVGWDVGVEWSGLPQLDDDLTADVCVVGLGGSGLAAVEAALDRGLSVVGVDAGRVGAGAAGRNGGFLLGGPAPFVHDALQRWGSPALDLYRETLAELDRLAASLPTGVVRRVGSIRLAGWTGSPDADELADCRAHAAVLRAHGIAVEDYDGPLGRGIFLPDDAATDPAARVLATAQRLRPRARLYEHSPVTSIDTGCVQTARGTVRAGAVVVAVDGRLPLVVPALAGRVRTARLQMLSTAPVAPGLVPCPVYGTPGLRLRPAGRRRAAVRRRRAGPVHCRRVDRRRVADPARPGARRGCRRGDRRSSRRRAPLGGLGRVHRRRPRAVHPGRRRGRRRGRYSGTGNLVGPVAARAALAYALDGTVPAAVLRVLTRCRSGLPRV